MNVRTTAYLLFASLLAPGLALAQASPPQPPVSRNQQAQMYEDIEIFRRLLNARLVEEYPPAREMARLTLIHCARCHAGDPRTAGRMPLAIFRDGTRNDAVWLDFDNSTPRLWTNDGRAVKWTRELEEAHRGVPGWDTTAGTALDTEGAYLKGQGVVYTLTLPRPAQDPTVSAGPPSSQPTSPWDRIRRELHNGKPEPAEPAPSRRETPLADIVLHVLAENGRHLTWLAENESITVVITFRGAEPRPVRGGGPNAPPGGSPRGAQQVPMTFGYKDANGTSYQLPVMSQSSPVGGGGPAAGSSEQDYELYGDLNLKQGRPDEAMRAYQKALEMKSDGKQAGTLHRKLAQALLAQGKVREARHELDLVMESAPGAAAKPAPPAASLLPAKLIVAASRRLLDQAGSGRLTFEEFRKEATVEYLTFPARPE